MWVGEPEGGCRLSQDTPTILFLFINTHQSQQPNLVTAVAKSNSEKRTERKDQGAWKRMEDATIASVFCYTLHYWLCRKKKEKRKKKDIELAANARA